MDTKQPQTLPLVSVIIPVYKEEAFLPTCLGSVLNQTYCNLEVILIDDGSPDKSPEICDRYAQEDRRVRVIHQQNAGLPMARNAGLDICTGEYITFVDSDDLLHVEFVERLVFACENSHAQIAIGKYTKDVVEKNVARLAEVQNAAMPEIINGREANFRIYDTKQWVRMITAWGKLFRRDLWQGHRFPNVKFHEDEALIYKLLYHCERIALVDNAMYFYTKNADGLMAHRFTPLRMTMVDILDERLKFYEEHGETGELALFTKNRQFMFAGMYYRQVLHYAPKKWRFRRSLRRKQRMLYPTLMRSEYPAKRKAIYTYAMLLPIPFNSFHF